MSRDLSRLQARLTGKNRNGVDSVMFISNEDDNKLHFKVNDADIFVDTRDLYKSFVKLMENLEQCTGKEYIPKHVAVAEHE